MRLIYRQFKFIIYRKATNFKCWKRDENIGGNEQNEGKLNKGELQKKIKQKEKTKKDEEKLAPNRKLKTGLIIAPHFPNSYNLF